MLTLDTDTQIFLYGFILKKSSFDIRELTTVQIISLAFYPELVRFLEAPLLITPCRRADVGSGFF